MADLRKRLETFTSWPKEHHLKKEIAAEAGFYYSGDADSVRCFFCGGGLRNWHPSDDAWLEHAHWFPQCGFVQQTLGQDIVQVALLLRKDHQQITMEMVKEKLLQVLRQRHALQSISEVELEASQTPSPRPKL
ncbi:baculoviral iap repeat-containing protein 7 [Plakobranchus ocellatus]|uniref:Baculoviral iap repeat-containing protein 7 n=1 Tax=Plakobranchus ocellatus TaxID=259542 RepID=A0AAV4B5S4_9GAST|nr:baculoviral iap repeat-containing protein 7 [Plakobranchus ocellatus]